jgi:hypothetical protein
MCLNKSLYEIIEIVVVTLLQNKPKPTATPPTNPVPAAI